MDVTKERGGLAVIQFDWHSSIQSMIYVVVRLNGHMSWCDSPFYDSLVA